MEETGEFTTQNTLLKDNEIKCITYDSRHKTIWVGNRWEEITRPDNMRDLKALAFEGDKIWVGGSGRGSMDGNTDK
jgi:hypothetical protein